MTREARIIGTIEAARSAGRNQRRFGFDDIGFLFINIKAISALYSPIFHQIVRNIDMIDDFNMRIFHHRSEDRFDVFPINFDIPISSCDIVAVFIFQND